MTNHVTVPHSVAAVDTLVALEREHYPLMARPQKANSAISSDSKYSGVAFCHYENQHYGSVDWEAYPCPTLLKARAEASEETLVAVALILGESK